MLDQQVSGDDAFEGNEADEEETGDEEPEQGATAVSMRGSDRASYYKSRKKQERSAEKQLRETYTITHAEVDFVAPKNPASFHAEMYGFIHDLDSIAGFANPGNEWERTMTRVEHRPSQWSSILEESKTRKAAMPQDQTVCVATTKEDVVRLCSSQPMRLPIYIPAATPYGNSLRQEKGVDRIADFVHYYLPRATKISVQQLHMPRSSANFTSHMKFEDVEDAFLHAKDDRILNCLDVGTGAYGVRHMPPELAEDNVLDLNEYKGVDVGRGSESKQWSQFFLLSKRGAISGVHTDGGGVGTWIQILDGQKLWYWGKGLNFMSNSDLQWLTGQSIYEAAGYTDGWSKLLLQKGDTFIMPPGTNHAVYTPSDCLCIGGFFLRRFDVPNSLNVLVLQDRYDHITNDGPIPQIFSKYRMYIELILLLRHDVTWQELERCRLALEGFRSHKVPSDKSNPWDESKQTRAMWCKEWQRFVNCCAKWEGQLRKRVQEITDGTKGQESESEEEEEEAVEEEEMVEILPAKGRSQRSKEQAQASRR